MLNEVPEHQVTMLLHRWRDGDGRALEELTSVVYNDLRRIAGYLLKGERDGHTLQPTALVNEAFIKWGGTAKINWQNRGHLIAIVARAMRQVLVEYARRHRRAKRDADVIPLEEALVYTKERSGELLALDEALDSLAVINPRMVQVVEMRFFGGFDNQEIARALKISPNTVMRDWNFAQAWLVREMKSEGK
jgi:RNA polymerase sigma-70 factor, ECF subfamily